MFDMKFEESGLLADFFGYSKVQLAGSTKYVCKPSFFSKISNLVKFCCQQVLAREVFSSLSLHRQKRRLLRTCSVHPRFNDA